MSKGLIREVNGANCAAEPGLNNITGRCNYCGNLGIPHMKDPLFRRLRKLDKRFD